jgi:hypothetical protein
MTLITRFENGEGEAMGCDRFQRGRGGGGEAAPRCWRRATHRTTGGWRSKMTKGNWVGRLNARLG